MVVELRLDPRAPAARTRGRCPGRSAVLGRQVSDLTLSTEFAEGSRFGLHRADGLNPQRRITKEEVD
jgi:hypothetical protein